jgi:hypothetical protein
MSASTGTTGSRVTSGAMRHLIDRRRPSSTVATIDGHTLSPPLSKGGRSGVDAKETAMRSVRCFLRYLSIVGTLVAATTACADMRWGERMFIQPLLSGVILGLLIGILLGYCLPHKLPRREEKQPEIDRLVEQFQELFRQIDRDKEA